MILFGEDSGYNDFENGDMDDWLLCEQKRYLREQSESKHNVHRDKRGRLNHGAKLAEKDSCNEVKIRLLYCTGMPVAEIMECMGCSKSTVYNVIKKHKKNSS